MNKEELLYNEIYDRTQNFGRTQFVREIMRLQRENKELQAKVNQLEKQLEHYKSKEIERINEDLLQVKNDYLERCIKAMVGDINE